MTKYRPKKPRRENEMAKKKTVEKPEKKPAKKLVKKPVGKRTTTVSKSGRIRHDRDPVKKIKKK